MANARTADYQAARHDLGRGLRSLREDCPPMETARLLLSYDGTGQRLVGLRYDGGRAVFVDGHRAIGIAFDGDGPDARRGVPLATFDAAEDVAEWAARWRYYWGWLHPRYRQE